MADSIVAILLLTTVSGIFGYIPIDQLSEKQNHYLTDALLRDVVSRMALSEPSAYGDYQTGVMSRANKDFEQFDYDSLLDGNPNPSIRDQELLQHSNSIWGHHFVTGGAGEGNLKAMQKNPEKLVKSDAALPAYCNPPNPCPFGYTEEQDCISEFENTAAFSRDYQQQQQCMCDGEHMFSCEQPEDSRAARFFRFQQDKRESDNPFLSGERLPIAAKKGFDVYENN